MQEIKVNLLRETSIAHIEEVCLQAGLTLRMKGRLKQLPHNMHWHFKLGKEKGVLELTFLPEKHELIFSVHDNRKGHWQEAMIARLCKALG